MDALRGRFGKYHVLDKIAQGGMAEIYKVKTVGLAGFEKVQALKRILPSAAQHGRFIRSFIDEARIAVELSHRNIVQVFDFGKAEGDLYLAMELIEGQDLRLAMTSGAARHVACPLGVAGYIISEVAAGLDYAHRKVDAVGRSLGIVHCDMSPSNVMLSSDGYVKILDFGIARASFSSALERRRLRGKPRYMAPEQTRGDQPTAATDVFALGIIAWELVAGRPLFGGAGLREILHEVRTLEVPPLRSLVPEVSAEMADAIATALVRDPAQRGTASDLGTACLRTALSSGPRGVARWLEEIAQRGSSPGGARISVAGGDGLLRRATSVPIRTSAVSIALREEVSEVDAPQLPPLGVGELDMPEVVVSESSGPTHADSRRPGRDTTPQRFGAVAAEVAADVADDEDSLDAALDRPTVVDPRGRAEAAADDNDDAIDDRPNELGMDEVAALGNRRRVVVAVALLEGGSADTARVLARSLGDLAYQRGGVTLVTDERSLTSSLFSLREVAVKRERTRR
ncbi:MAG TPA: serine/threonine-protein kinase, partial [Kofleriaceae bacterium]|nr:serine/threonine-protein kinase [Kofleriaceae bacterium]